jgi:RNA polymerase sigma factor (sigma-70 family)
VDIPDRLSVIGEAERVEEGWPAGLVAAYERHYRELVVHVTMMLGSRHEAEEIVQDVFVAARARWSTVDDPRPYLYRAATNRAVGALRRRRTAEQHVPDRVPAGTPSRLVELRDVMLALPERQRAALVLRYVADLPDEEIARILGCRRATVRSLVARGLAALHHEVTK